MKKMIWTFLFLFVFTSHAALARPIQDKVISQEKSLNTDKAWSAQFADSVSSKSTKTKSINLFLPSQNLWFSSPAIQRFGATLPTVNELCRQSLQQNLPLEERLERCWGLANQIQWQLPDGRYLSYPDWPREKKERLEYFFQQYQRQASVIGMVCETTTAPDRLPNYLHENEAFDMYAGQVAHAFYVEANRLVPWSLTSLPLLEVSVLLNSNSLFSIIVDRSSMGRMPDMGEFRAGRDYQLVPHWTLNEYPCDLRQAFGLMSGRNNTLGRSLIGADRTETMANLSLWAAKNLTHQFVMPTSDQFRDRFSSRDFDGERVIPAPAGCHSASRMLRELARSVNIPLLAGYSTTLPPDLQANHARINGMGYSFLGFSHAGLVYQWSTSPRILVHVDNLYAENDAPFWAIQEGDSRVVNERELARRFYEVMWLSLDQVRLRNYAANPGFAPIEIGVGIGQYTTPPQGTVPTFDNTLRYLGYYQLTLRTDLSRGHSNSLYHHAYARKYQLCSWTNFLEEYCERPEIFTDDIRSRSYYNDRPADVPLPYPDFFIGRAQSCLRVIGDCRAAEEQAQDWYVTGYGGCGWRD